MGRGPQQRKKQLHCDQKPYIHIHVYIMSLASSLMITFLTTHKILNKRRIKGLVYRTRNSVIFIGPGLLGFLGRNLCVHNVFAILKSYYLPEKMGLDSLLSLSFGSWRAITRKKLSFKNLNLT